MIFSHYSPLTVTNLKYCHFRTTFCGHIDSSLRRGVYRGVITSASSPPFPIAPCTQVKLHFWLSIYTTYVFRPTHFLVENLNLDFTHFHPLFFCSGLEHAKQIYVVKLSDCKSKTERCKHTFHMVFNYLIRQMMITLLR